MENIFSARLIIFLLLVFSVYLMRSSETETENFQFDRIMQNTQNYSSQVCQTLPPGNVEFGYGLWITGLMNDFFNQTRSENKLLSSLKNQELSFSNYVNSFSTFFGLGISGIVFGILACCCLGQNCKFMKLIVEQTEEKRECCSFTSIFILVGIVQFSIIGIYSSHYHSEEFNRAGCYGAEFLDSIQYGNLSSQWVGLLPASATLINLTTQLPYMISSLSTTTYPNDISSQVENTFSSIYSFEINNINAKVTFPSDNPIITSKITPDYIATLGPSTKNLTLSFNLTQEVYLKSNLTQNISTSTPEYISSLSSQSSTILEDIKVFKFHFFIPYYFTSFRIF